MCAYIYIYIYMYKYIYIYIGICMARLRKSSAAGAWSGVSRPLVGFCILFVSRSFKFPYPDDPSFVQVPLP